MLSRRRARRPAARPPADLTVLAVEVDDRPSAPRRPRASEDDWATLRRVVAEVVILQDAAEELLLRLRDRPDPSTLAVPCGRLKWRFVELREALPLTDDPEIDRYRTAVRQILDHHVLYLKTSMGFLAAEPRRPELGDRLDGIDGLGAPARRLERLRVELLRRNPPA